MRFIVYYTVNLIGSMRFSIGIVALLTTRLFLGSGFFVTLHQVMGHGDMKVSLTYLRGIEVKQLDVNDLPEL